MAKAALVVMAAGIGSRFGGGIKQLEPVGPGGEIIMDYSIHDAMKAGFDKVVFVIRKNLEKDFKEIIGRRIEKIIETAYAYQEVDDIPDKYKEMYSGRTKPWGTGQAILACKDVVNEPFLVINADDYYGREGYVTAYNELTREAAKSDQAKSGKMRISMIGFKLANTLSDNGGVSRGICKVDDNGMLLDITETFNIIKKGSGAAILSDGCEIPVSADAPVSMNMWGLGPDFFDVLKGGFEEFLDGIRGDYMKAEYLLPGVIGDLVHEGRADVKVLPSRDKWFGVTYKEDKAAVVSSIRSLIDEGLYPERLF